MDGTYVGIGTSEGTVAVYGADDLQVSEILYNGLYKTCVG